MVLNVFDPSVPVKGAGEPLRERGIMRRLLRIAVTEGGLGGSGNAGRGEDAEKHEPEA